MRTPAANGEHSATRPGWRTRMYVKGRFDKVREGVAAAAGIHVDSCWLESEFGLAGGMHLLAVMHLLQAHCISHR
ncbi:hypothetical protein BGY98DRAFT_1005049, partial [Russula aff. rugulosa BPL654]